MSTTGRATKTIAAGSAAAFALGALIGAGPVNAAPVPTIAVAAAGDSDWQITYHRGSATRRDTRCRVWMDDRIVASPERELAEQQKARQQREQKPEPGSGAPGAAAKHKAPTKPPVPMLMTTTLRGESVPPGAHRVNVRCGRSVSPTIWLIAPRNQIWDGVTWLSNGTAGLIGY